MSAPLNPRALVALLLLSCGAMDAAPTSQSESKALEEEADDRAYGGAPPPPEAPMPASAPVAIGSATVGRKDKGGERGEAGPMDGADRFAQVLLPAGDAEKDGNLAEGESAPARSRSWFPETFLWAPRVVTDAQGVATVPVRVPDRLTEWRILALAHSRTGGVAGAVASFQGSLPVYVDPVVPPFLMQGDRLRLPVQVVNTTDSPRRITLDLELSGAITLKTTGQVALPPGGSEVIWTELVAGTAGEVQLKASLGGADAVERSFQVRPAGRPLSQTRGGTLAAPREIELLAPIGADPDSARARLAVFPGALSVLRRELASAGDRSGVDGTAYALLLSGQGPALLARLGQPVSRGGEDPEARAIAEKLRTLRIQATARAAQLSRDPSLLAALALVEPALSHPDDPVLARLGDRLLEHLARIQRPDGSFGGDGEGRWTVQRLLVATAEATRSAAAAAATPGEDAEARDRRGKIAQRIALLSGAAFERYASQISDGYTAAALLASGGVKGALAETLRAQVIAALEVQPDGSRLLPVAEGVQRADGFAPSTLEATALAALALKDKADPGLVADLGAAVLGGWRPGAGWGDGATDRVALQAVIALFDAPLPDAVTITLSRDGEAVARRDLDASALRDLVVLEAPAAAGPGLHSWTIAADPPVAGLGFQLDLQSWVAWPEAAPTTGLELQAPAPVGLRLGQRGLLDLTAAAPAGQALVLDQGLPAGVQVDSAPLEALVMQGTLSRYRIADGSLHLEINPLAPAETLRLRLPVTPTLSGRLLGGATTLMVAGRDDLALTLPPVAWTIGG